MRAVWRPFSLLEVNRRDEAPPVFERAEHADNVSLVALAVHQAVDAAGGNVDAYGRRMFTAWHDEPGRLSTADIVGFGRAAGLNRYNHDHAFTALTAEHVTEAKLGIFGTPALIYPDSDAAFVKHGSVPQTAEQATALWSTARTLAAEAPELHESHCAPQQRRCPDG